MSQEEIIELLKKKKKPMISIEIASELDKSQQAVLTSLSKMLKLGELVKRKPTKEEESKYKNDKRNKIVWNFYVYEIKKEKKKKK